MLIEGLIRMGLPLLKRGGSPAEVIRQITDIETGAHFYQNVLFVEIDVENRRFAVHPLMAWGDWLEEPAEGGSGKRKKAQVQFVPNRERTVATPFVLPKGGNPTKPQGRYGIPVYLLYDKHFRELGGKPDGVRDFLARRLSRTQLWRGAVETEELAAPIAEAFQRLAGVTDKQYGLLVLAEVGEDGPYLYAADRDPQMPWVASSRLHPGMSICAHLATIEEAAWQAKLAEGTEKGELDDGRCTCCGTRGPVVSMANQAWPLFAFEWRAPLPSELSEEELVKGVALCHRCYRALTLGGQFCFSTASRRLPAWMTRELFAPVVSRGGDATRQVRQEVYAGLIITPLEDLDEEAEEEFAKGLDRFRQKTIHLGRGLPLDQVLGLEQTVLPEDLTASRFRLTVLYYSGEVARKNVHLLAVIEDVTPSVAQAVDRLLYALGQEVGMICTALHLQVQRYEKQLTRLPSLLALAYGYGYVWQALGRILHRQPISLKPMIRHAVLRMQECAARWRQEDARWAMREEVLRYLVFRAFWQAYMREVAEKEEEVPVMRPWPELLEELKAGGMEFDRSIDELGFAAGYLVRWFSRRYWRATEKNSSKGKDYLAHRVMTFGSRLTPETIWSRAILPMPEYAMRVNMKLSETFRRQHGAWLMAYRQLQQEVQKERDAFLAAFWAGYHLADSVLGSDETDGERAAADGEMLPAEA